MRWRLAETFLLPFFRRYLFYNTSGKLWAAMWDFLLCPAGKNYCLKERQTAIFEKNLVFCRRRFSSVQLQTRWSADSHAIVGHRRAGKVNFNIFLILDDYFIIFICMRALAIFLWTICCNLFLVYEVSFVFFVFLCLV